MILILDEAGERVVHASEAASALRRGIADPSGRVSPVLRLTEQLRRVGRAGAKPIIARIQFDARRIAPPCACLIARAALPSGAAVSVVALVETPPRLRAITANADRGFGGAPPITKAREPDRSPIIDAAPTMRGPARFTWRSDDDDVITQISGLIGETARAALIDRSWGALAAAGTLRDAEGVLAALSARRTFRAIVVTLRPGARSAAAAQRFELEVSGAPLGRSGRGFAGFGLFRAALDADQDDEPARAVIASEINAPSPSHAAAAEFDRAEPSEPPAEPTLEAFDATPSPLLSSNEHDAFREIARALGARFAGDDAPEPTLPAPVCSVTPFPARPPETALDPAITATLEQLPSGALVYRGAAALFANRRLLDLAGYADLAAIEAAGGIARLFPGLAPHERAASDAPATLSASDGRSLSIDLQHAGMDWRGAPAELVLARAALAHDSEVERAAERVSQDFAARRAQDALAIVETLDDGVATLDSNGRVLTLNGAGAALFGLDPREIVGGGFASLFAPESAMAVLAAIHGPAGGADSPAAREATARARGRHAPLGLRISPLRPGADGALCALIRDLTQSRRAETESASARHAAEAASAHKSDFLATISHEIRTPMNSILGFADVMLSEQFGPIGAERYRGYLRDIHASGSHVLSLVNDLLDLAKIEAGRLDLAFTDVPLNDLVSGCVALMQPQAARERIVVRTSFSADLTTLVADERSVRQAALNVIANAIQFTEAGGQVIVSTTIAERGEIALRVRDTGIGMTPDEVETALEPFRQVAASNGRKGGGTGLGLPLTKALVEANHGRFHITSRKDEGTLVEMVFPAPDALSA